MTPEQRALREIARYCQTSLDIGVQRVTATTILKMAHAVLDSEPAGRETEERVDDHAHPDHAQRRSDDRPDRAGHRGPDPVDRVHDHRPLATLAERRKPAANHPWRQYQQPAPSRQYAAQRPFNPARERLDMRTTPAMRAQLNDLMQHYQINVSEAVRRAVEFWWRRR
jgi:hypothetical protein